MSSNDLLQNVEKFKNLSENYHNLSCEHFFKSIGLKPETYQQQIRTLDSLSYYQKMKSVDCGRRGVNNANISYTTFRKNFDNINRKYEKKGMQISSTPPIECRYGNINFVGNLKLKMNENCIEKILMLKSAIESLEEDGEILKSLVADKTEQLKSLKEKVIEYLKPLDEEEAEKLKSLVAKGAEQLKSSDEEAAEKLKSPNAQANVRNVSSEIFIESSDLRRKSFDTEEYQAPILKSYLLKDGKHKNLNDQKIYPTETFFANSNEDFKNLKNVEFQQKSTNATPLQLPIEQEKSSNFTHKLPIEKILLIKTEAQVAEPLDVKKNKQNDQNKTAELFFERIGLKRKSLEETSKKHLNAVKLRKVNVRKKSPKLINSRKSFRWQNNNECRKKTDSGENEFQILLAKHFPNLKTRQLTRFDWQLIRSKFGKPRLCSEAFFAQKRAEMHQNANANIRTENVVADCEMKTPNDFETLKLHDFHVKNILLENTFIFKMILYVKKLVHLKRRQLDLLASLRNKSTQVNNLPYICAAHHQSTRQQHLNAVFSELVIVVNEIYNLLYEQFNQLDETSNVENETTEPQNDFSLECQKITEKLLQKNTKGKKINTNTIEDIKKVSMALVGVFKILQNQHADKTVDEHKDAWQFIWHNIEKAGQSNNCGSSKWFEKAVEKPFELLRMMTL